MGGCCVRQPAPLPPNDPHSVLMRTEMQWGKWVKKPHLSFVTADKHIVTVTSFLSGILLYTHTITHHAVMQTSPRWLLFFALELLATLNLN